VSWYTSVTEDGRHSHWHRSDFRGSTQVNNQRELKALKRKEAESRNSHTPHNRTKRHRLGKCGC